MLVNIVVFLFKTISKSFLVFCFISFLPGLPPTDMEFSPYSVTPVVPLEGALSLNNRLDNTERLFEDEIKGPEGLAEYNGELYTGIRGGDLIKIKDNQIHRVLKFGGNCDNLWDESKCGRIMGLTFDKNGLLHIADAYHGLFRANFSSGNIETIVAKDEVIDGKPLKTPNCIEIGSDGIIYWTISSTSHDLHDALYTFFDNGNGRLMKTDMKKKTHEVLMENLHFPNGVALSEDESFLLVAETPRARILRYYLKGPKKGTNDVFIDGLPGLPDNLRRTSTGDFLVPLAKSIEHDEYYIPFLLTNFPLQRKFVVRVATLIELALGFVNHYIPIKFLQDAKNIMGHFDSIRALPQGSNRTTFLKVNSEGSIIDSYHTTDGSVTGISDVIYFQDAYYFGSPFNSYLGRLKIAEYN